MISNYCSAACLGVLMGLSLPVEAQRSGRLAPPEAVDCERDDLTSFAGEVVSLTAAGSMLQLNLLTDWGSKESFQFDPEAPQLENGKPITAPRSPELRVQVSPRLNVIVWVCEAPRSVTVDWRPQAD